MAYIPWWQRYEAPTFAERFELGGLARVSFKKGSDPIASLSFEQIRKLFPTYFDAAATATKVDEGVIKKILQMYANKEGGRTYIGKQLGLDQSVVGRILNKAEANKLITKVNPGEFTKTSQKIYENPKARKIHNVVRPVTSLDRAQNPNIPKNAKFKVVFATPQGKTTKIPDEFIGVKYFDNEKSASAALDKRLKADFITSENPGAAKLMTQQKRSGRLKKTAPFYAKTGTKGKFQFHHIMPIGGSTPLTVDDIAIISKEMNSKLSDVNKRLNNIADEIDELYKTKPKGYLEKVKKLNDTAEGIVKNKIKSLPKEYKNLIGFNRVDPVVVGGKVKDYKITKIGGIDKGGIKLVDLSKKERIDLQKKILEKSKELDIEDQKFLKKVKNVSGKVLKATGKVIRPVGYLIGANAVLQAKAQAEEQGIDLKLVDYYAALEMGEPEAAFDMWKMRNVPEFAAEVRAKNYSIPLDEGTYEAIDEQFTEKEVEPTGVEKYIQVTNQ
jgi:DNA-binding MarR family transcriptional regulator